MKALEFPAYASRPAIGLAYSTYVPDFVARNESLVDYVEVPFELIRYDPVVLGNVIGLRPLILHCASLSIAGYVPPTQTTIDAVNECLSITRSPWLGEHLAFLTADPVGAFDEVPIGDSAPPTNIGYTVSPVPNLETLDQVTGALAKCSAAFRVQTILENGPAYLHYDESTLTHFELLTRITQTTHIGLILDLAHYCITCYNSGLDPHQSLDSFPVESVVEIHISGFSTEAGSHWDNHATPAPEIVYELLATVLSRCKPRAITLEYNWSPTFKHDLLVREICRVQSAIA